MLRSDLRLATFAVAGVLALAAFLAFLESSPWSIAACVLGICLLVVNGVSRCRFVGTEQTGEARHSDSHGWKSGSQSTGLRVFRDD